MASPSPDRTTEWEGGSLGELVSVLQAAALPVRIEVIAPGTMGSNAGEVHLLAGGLADAFAGSLRRDDAMAALQRLEGARFVVESRLPNPETGSLAEPGPREGSLKDRPLASLMRYCEDYVLTCRLEIQRGQEKAVISYQRGEIAGTTVDGKDDEENLPGVLAWPDGSYEIVLPAPVLPPIPARKRDMLNAGRISEAGTKPERKRHGTLPMAPAAQAAPPPVLAYPARMVPAPTAPFEPVKPSAVVQTPAEPQAAASTAPFEPVKPAAVVQTHAEPAAAAPSPPSQPAPRPSIPPLSALHLPFSSQPAAPAPQAPVRSPEPVMAGQPPAAPAEPFPPETTKRGIPTLPPVPPVPQPAARPATQGLPAPSVRGKLPPSTVPSRLRRPVRASRPRLPRRNQPRRLLRPPCPGWQRPRLPRSYRPNLYPRPQSSRPGQPRSSQPHPPPRPPCPGKRRPRLARSHRQGQPRSHPRLPWSCRPNLHPRLLQPRRPNLYSRLLRPCRPSPPRTHPRLPRSYHPNLHPRLLRWCRPNLHPRRPRPPPPSPPRRRRQPPRTFRPSSQHRRRPQLPRPPHVGD
jgi:hypothetical protein